MSVLNEALRPRRRATRDGNKLIESFGPCRTRADFQTAFSAWLDGGENLADDDEISLDTIK